jgi:hypothetical protein
VLAAGGVSFETGPVVLLGSLGVNAGLPNFMLNLDLTVGMGFRL